MYPDISLHLFKFHSNNSFPLFRWRIRHLTHLILIPDTNPILGWHRFVSLFIGSKQSGQIHLCARCLVRMRSYMSTPFSSKGPVKGAGWRAGLSAEDKQNTSSYYSISCRDNMLFLFHPQKNTSSVHLIKWPWWKWPAVPAWCPRGHQKGHLGWISVSVAYVSFTIDDSFVICSFRAGQIIVHFLQLKAGITEEAGADNHTSVLSSPFCGCGGRETHPPCLCRIIPVAAKQSESYCCLPAAPILLERIPAYRPRQPKLERMGAAQGCEGLAVVLLCRWPSHWQRGPCCVVGFFLKDIPEHFPLQLKFALPPCISDSCVWKEKCHLHTCPLCVCRLFPKPSTCLCLWWARFDCAVLLKACRRRFLKCRKLSDRLLQLKYMTYRWLRALMLLLNWWTTSLLITFGIFECG